MTTTVNVRVLPQAELFVTAAAEFIRVANDCVGAAGRFTVALAGGGTPRTLYSLLAQKTGVPWERTYVFFGDERHVPPGDPQSNYRMANEAMLSRVSVPAENVFRIKAENPDAAEAAADYEKALRDFFRVPAGGFPRFDLVLLGMGPDGHTASLFPGSGALQEQRRLAVANWVEEFRAYRITLTLPVLNHAADVVFLAAGADKAVALEQVLEGPESARPPAGRVRPEDGRLTWLVDPLAAARLASQAGGASASPHPGT